jgi:hypothetical protein
MHAQAVKQVAAPSAQHQRTGNQDGDGTAAAYQDEQGSAQQPEVQQVEQCARYRGGVPRTNRAPDQHIAARVDLRPGDVAPGPPLDRLIQDNDRRYDREHDLPLPGLIPVLLTGHFALTGLLSGCYRAACLT